MKISLSDRIKAKFYGSGWLEKYYKGEVKDQQYYLKENKRLLYDVKKLGHLPPGVSQTDVAWAKADKKLLPKIINESKKQLRKWKELNKAI